MLGNSSTSNFNRITASYVLTLILGFYGFFLTSVGLFFYKPEVLYWRAWEFFEDFIYNSPNCQVLWENNEKGDFSHKCFLANQKKWKTKVSCDSDGFRSVPIHANQYPVLVVGDSNTWGCGLSDHETFAWQLAEKLQTPIFNGGKRPNYLEYLINKDDLKKTKLIIELSTTHLLDRKVYKNTWGETFTPRPYQPLVAEKRSFLQVFTPRRYFLPFKIFTSFTLDSVFSLRRWRKILNYFRPHNPYTSLKTLDDLEYVVEQLTRRAQALKDLGYHYLFIPVPNINLIESENVDPFTLWWESELVCRLNTKGVDAIDLVRLFREHRENGLYFETDSHWNSSGVNLAVSEVANYLREHPIEKFPP